MVAVVAVVLGVLSVSACPASAAAFAGSKPPTAASARAASTVDGGLLLSTDGERFSDSPPDRLFDGLKTLVPGHSVSARLWVKNATNGPAELHVRVGGVSLPSPMWSEKVGLTAWSSLSGRTDALPLGALESCSSILPAARIEAHGVVETAYTFTMADLASVEGQTESAEMTLLVSLQDAAVGESFPADGCRDDETPVPDADRSPGYDSIASTGASSPLPLLAAGALLVGGGLFLLIERRRRT